MKHLLLGLAVIFLLPFQAEAYTLYGNSYPSPKSDFYYNQGLAGIGWQDAMNSAKNQWNDAGSNFTFTQIGLANRAPSTIYSNTCDGYSDIAYKAMGSNSSILGVTMWCNYFYSDGTTVSPYISESDVALNTDKPLSVTPGSYLYDAQGILTHELGHFLILDHSNVGCGGSQPAVMCPNTNLGDFTSGRTLKTDDINGIIAIYGN